MSLKNVRYTRLETDDSEGGEDDSPPTHIDVNSESPYIKGSRWNHIDNLDEFFERVYEYQQKNGLAAIFLGDVMELIQFLFIVLFTTFLVTCLNVTNLLADTVYDNSTKDASGNPQRNVKFSDLFDLGNFQNINFIVVLFLLMAFVFWIHRLSRTAVRFYRFWGIRNFYKDALHISPSELCNTQWADVVVKLKHAQRQYKMNIQKQELTELDVYHRILRFKNYLVAMVNKGVIQCRFSLPLYGEKVFFTHGLKFNYELILFWPSLKAPFKNSFYLREEYKSASKKQELIQNLKFRITVLAFLNLIFCPVIFLYQLLYSFFSYAELLKNQPGVFGRRRWSLYGHWYLRDFNELEHEFTLRLNRAYKPAVKYMDLFVDPLLTLLAKNVSFIAGSLFAVLLVLTVIQEDLLTAHNVLTVLTALGIIITVCRIFVPSENQVWQPAGLMQRILGEIHYMPDHWKKEPHNHQVYKEFTHVFQFTMMFVIDELLSPLITPFILYFHLRHKASDIVDFLRNFTIDVSGVGDVCSFAEMNVRKHGNPEWLTEGVSRANQYEQAELGKTEISLMHFSRKNPDWKPDEDGSTFMNQLRESVEGVQRSSYNMSTSAARALGQQEELGAHNVLYPSLTHDSSAILQGSHYQQTTPTPHLRPHPQQQQQQAASSDAMQWSIWSVRPEHQYTPLNEGRGVAGGGDYSMMGSTMDTLQIHQLHDLKKESTWTQSTMMNSDPLTPLYRPFASSSTSSSSPSFTPHGTSPWETSFTGQERSEDRVPLSGPGERSRELKEPLLAHATGGTGTTEHAQLFASSGHHDPQESFHSVAEFEEQQEHVASPHLHGTTPATAVVELHAQHDDS